QTSIKTQGRVTVRLISPTIFFAISSLRYSSRYFMARSCGRPDLRGGRLRKRIRFRIVYVRYIELTQLLKLLERFICSRGLFFINFAECETDMDQDVIANHDLGCVFQADLFYYSAEIRLTHPHALRVGGDFNQFTGNRQTHRYSPRRQPVAPCRWRRRRTARPYPRS